jgi:hypothetical protein
MDPLPRRLHAGGSAPADQTCGYPGARFTSAAGRPSQRPHSARFALVLCQAGQYDVRLYHRADLADQVCVWGGGAGGRAGRGLCDRAQVVSTGGLYMHGAADRVE